MDPSIIKLEKVIAMKKKVAQNQSYWATRDRIGHRQFGRLSIDDR